MCVVDPNLPSGKRLEAERAECFSHRLPRWRSLAYTGYCLFVVSGPAGAQQLEGVHELTMGRAALTVTTRETMPREWGGDAAQPRQHLS